VFASISEQSTATSSSKRPHEFIDHDLEEDDSNRFMGGARRKKKSQKLDGAIEAGPSHSSDVAQADVGLNHNVVRISLSINRLITQ